MPPELPTDGPSLEVAGGRGLRAVVAVGGVVLAIAVVAVAAFLLVGRDDGDADPAGSTTTGSTTPGAPATKPTLDLPTIDPSDFPSDLPTTSLPDLPSGIPSGPDRPTRVPSGVPSGMPTSIPDFPTDPADLESWFSDYLEQVHP
ncbi:hypothetical protein [Nocardioides nitrophenolicus]|uniref:hypothetical protein n=1 Tax=Nocardioides nitrophenolicus TaxID=60489 RepID=UPI0019591CAC|nr:hypothetical protein [Nocardioides nitrophenolicus]MBM7516855.1 hypothetical protein [Nocardioides nitrophenolicus]